MESSIKEHLLSLSFVQQLKCNEQQKCWVDGSNCPYGNPEGQFNLRPEKFCQLGNCNKINIIEGDLTELMSDEPISLSTAIEETIKERYSQFDDDEKILLIAVAKMLKDKKL
ncbi:MAG: hypothetical protein JW740_00380 [Candidatus Zambryskibacteria bacterium]|nr:hypothetical protein [Candidatus Zambryskibacteria bacterium]